ncbi:hypothetical protein VTJ04DRAFT_5847 [Mycothermus thermophilus]|uniref:uncharacterized protein n=1 Tax=Humicola insolens TaxID=85995 RepID=UPI003741EAC5
MPEESPVLPTGHFLALPTELRFIIYDMVLLIPDRILIAPGVDISKLRAYYSHLFVQSQLPKVEVSLLRVNRQIAAETTQRFYSMNTFAFTWLSSTFNERICRLRWNPMIEWLQKIGRNGEYIRKIEYNFGWDAADEVKRTFPNIARIQPLAPNLRNLIIRYEVSLLMLSSRRRQFGVHQDDREAMLDFISNVMREAGFKEFEGAEIVSPVPFV